MPINYDGFRYFNDGDEGPIPEDGSPPPGTPIAKVDYRVHPDPADPNGLILNVSDPLPVVPGQLRDRKLIEFPAGFQSLVIDLLTMDDGSELTGAVLTSWWGDGLIAAVDLYITHLASGEYEARARLFMMDGWFEDLGPILFADSGGG